MHLSISSYTWLPASFLGKLDLLKRFDIDSVEIFVSPRHLDIRDAQQVQNAGMRLRDLGFQTITMHAPSYVGDLSSPIEELRNDTTVNCQKVLDAAMLLGAQLVTFHPASIDGEAREADWRWPSLHESLRELSGYAEDRNLNLAVENLPEPFFGNDPKELYDEIANLDLPNVGLCLDIGHAFVGKKIPDVIDLLGHKIFSVQASDNRGSVDEHLPPGHGFVPWDDVLSKLRGLGLHVPFIIEVRDNRKTEIILEDIVEFAAQKGISGVGQLSH